MPNHVTALEWSDDDFNAVVRKVEAAFSGGFAAYYYSTSSSSHLIDVFDPQGAEFTASEWQRWGAGVAGMDQLVIFAFADAPDTVVESWGKEHGDRLGAVAVARVHQMRDNMSSAAQEWGKRSRSPGNIVGDLTVDVVYNPNLMDAQGLLRVDSFIPSGTRRTPIGSSRHYLTAVVTRNDLKRLIHKLEEAVAFMPVFDLEGEGGADHE